MVLVGRIIQSPNEYMVALVLDVTEAVRMHQLEAKGHLELGSRGKPRVISQLSKLESLTHREALICRRS